MKYLAIIILLTIGTADEASAQFLSRNPYGFYQDRVKLKRKEFVSILKKDPKAKKVWNSRHGYWLGAAGAGILTCTFFLGAVGTGLNEMDTTPALIAVGVSGSGMVLLSVLGGRSTQKAIKVYNQNNGFSSTDIQLGITNNGIGIVYSF